MALQIATTRSGIETQYDLATDSLLVLSGTFVTSSTDFAVKTTGTNQSVDVLGFVGGFGGISFSNLSGVAKVNLATSGAVYASDVAISIRAADAVVINYGQISSAQSVGLDFVYSSAGSAGKVANFGTIHGYSAGIRVGDNAGQIDIRNYGTISASPGKDGDITDRGGAKAIFTGTEYDLLVNRGRIVGDVFLNGGNDQLINRGVIAGDVDMGFAVDGGQDDLVDNTGGTIDGYIMLGQGQDTLRPGAGIELAYGHLGTDLLDFSRSSGVTLALDDSLDATGWAEGDTYNDFENITGSKYGSDRLVGDGGTNILKGLGGNDVLAGQDGDDTLQGGRGNDTLDGGAGNDTLEGGDGKDVLTDSSGANFFYGGAGSDRITGGAGNDYMTGDGDNDTLAGGAGDDVIYGGAGNDVITGGTGYDYMVGNEGADRFVLAAGDIPPGQVPQSGPVEQILDFNRGERDRIDLSGIDANTKLTGDQAFTLVASGGFTGVVGELVFTAATGNLYVSGDVNGDAKADFTFIVSGPATSLLASDFVL